MTNIKEKIGGAVCHVYLIILSIIAFFPLVWILMCSIKSSGELTANPTHFLPKQATLENFVHVINDLGFALNISNSLLIALFTTCIAIVMGSCVFSQSWGQLCLRHWWQLICSRLSCWRFLIRW